MSNLLNKARDKVEQALQKDKNQHDNPQSGNAGPHSSNMGNKFDPSVDSDRDGRNDPTSRVGGYGNTQTGPGVGGGVAHSDTYGSSNTNPGYDDPRSANTGPHGSNMGNKLDPRVDSDNDNRNNPAARAGGYGNTQQYGDNYGQAGGPGGIGSTDTGYGGTHTGVHGGAHSGTHTGTHTGAHTGAHAGGPGGYTSSQTGYDNPRSANDGPHGSNLANKLDPRVDSDRDGRNDPTSRSGGYGNTQTTHGGYDTGVGSGAGAGYGAGEPGIGHTGGYGAPGSGAGAGAGYGAGEPGIGRTGGYGASGAGAGYGAGEPGIGGGYGQSHTGAGGYGTGPGAGPTGGYEDSSYTPGTGSATKTAGPHDSNIMNKLDPRVDSDMDGSKTYGGNQTHR